jgi:HAE1 family hydrophobic/amphiphilic exporter-1
MTTGYPGARIGVSTPAGVRLPGLGGGFGGGGDVTVNLTGPDLNVLQKLGDEVAQQISTVPGTRNVLNTLDQTSPEYSLTIDRDAAQHFGVTQKDIMTALRNAYQGAIATQFDTGNLAINVLIKFPEQFTNNVENLNNISINTTSGAIVPLNQVAKVTLGSGPAQIRRLNQNRVAVVQANVFGATVGDVQAQVQQVVDAIQPPDGYTVTMGSGAKQQSSTFAALYGMLGISILLVYMVMASQFESLYGPFVIMFSLPPTFVGAILGLLVTHRTINMNSIIGMIMLVGIVVNNAIVLIDYTNQLRKRGMTLSEALVQAGQIRLRPILMTTCTTVLAMLPLVIGFGEGAETQASMATVVAFGLTLSTMVTLVLVPVVYTLMEDGINRIKRLFRRNPHTPTAPQEPSVTH